MARRTLMLIGAIVVGTVGLSPAVASAARSALAPSPPAPASPSSASSSAPDPTPATAAPAQAGGVTVVWIDACENYGADVTNHDTIAHTETMVVDGRAGTPVEVPPGATRHVDLAETTPPASTVRLVDSVEGVIVDTIVHFCVTTLNMSVTIKANSSYTLTTEVSPYPTDPKPQHGSLESQEREHSLRYTPEPCFSGTDRFGFNDPISETHGVITVHVQPGPCRVTVKRSALDCGQRSATYTAANPYTLPATVEVRQPGSGGPKTVTVPPHSTKAVLAARLDPPGAGSETFTFRLVESGATLHTDTVHCAASASPGSRPTPESSAGLAATGSSTAEPAAFGGAGLVMLGAGLLVAGRRRRTDG